MEKSEARKRYLATGECYHKAEHYEKVNAVNGTTEIICGICGKRIAFMRGLPYDHFVEDVLQSHDRPMHVQELYKKLPNIAQSSIRRVLSTKKDIKYKQLGRGLWTLAKLEVVS